MAEQVVRDAANSMRLRWALRDESGIVSAGSPAGIDGTPMVLVDFPGRFPPLSLGLLPPATGTIQSFFTSPSSVYLYAFVLVAGVLAGGLALTVRTISHQLELARMQSDFVSTVSHEFKSPLTAIRQHAEMLKAGRAPSEARRQRYFDVLVEQSERLTALIDHVLDFARIDAGHTELDLVEVDLETFLGDVVSAIQGRVGSQDFVIRQEIESDFPPVTMDPEGIALVLTNLIDNAIKFSGASREVIVRCRAEDAQVVITVRDFGIGLNPSERERVFERFYRGEDARKRAVKGTGLGLTLVKRTIEAHAGSISVDSEPGKGSAFTVRLPVSGP
jgi:signal transduction histidine kinase